MGGKVVLGTGASLVIVGVACILLGYYGSEPLITVLGFVLLAICVFFGFRSGI